MSGGSHISERERAEAACVTANRSGHQFELQLGHLCNERCVFCSSGQITQLKLARHIPLDPMIAAIEEARAGGARRITFLGGEPTLHKGLPSALKRAVDLGFEEIVIFTNGVMLPHPGFIDRIVALGRFEWRVSIQGATEEAHVAVTGRKDSFRRIVNGLKLLRDRGQDVTANVCLNERNYRSLPQYPPLVRELGVRQLHLDIVRPSSMGERTEEYVRDVMPRYALMAPALDEMLTRFAREDPSFDVNVGNLPYCILPQWAHRISHGGEQTITQACDATQLEVAVDKYEWHASMRRHVPACEGCAFRRQCTGVFSKYLELYGDEEFRPVKLESLRPADHFVLFMRADVDALKAPPIGWVLGRVVEDTRGQRVDIHFLTAEGSAGEHPLSLHFTPPGSGTPAVHVTGRYRLGLTAHPAIAEEDFVRLLSWAAKALRVTLNFAEITEAHRRGRVVAQGRSRMRTLVRRVEDQRQFGDWRAGASYDEGDDTVVELLGPADGRIDVVFTIRSRDGRSSVSLDARPQGVDPAIARAVVLDLAKAIRDPA